MCLPCPTPAEPVIMMMIDRMAGFFEFDRNINAETRKNRQKCQKLSDPIAPANDPALQ
jgi:hypothetical protein